MMEKFTQRLLMLFALSGMLFFMACGDDDEDNGPSLVLEEGASLVSMDTTVNEDTLITVAWVATAGTEELDVFTITVADTIYETINLTGDDRQEFSSQELFTIPSYTEDTDVDFEFTVQDAEGLTDTEGFVLTVRDKDIEESRVVLLAAPLTDRNSETFYSTNLNRTFSYNDVVQTSENVSQDIDLGYYFGATDGASLAGPANYPDNIYFSAGDSSQNDLEEFWSTLRETTFRTTNLSSGDFLAIDEGDDIEEAFENGSNETMRVTNLLVGDVIAFQTRTDDADEGRFGILQVLSIDDGFGAGDGIEFDLKLEEED